MLLGLLLLRLVVSAWRRRRRPIAPARDYQPDDWLGWLDAGLLAIGVVYLLVRPFVAQVAVVTSTSMAPTLHGTLTPETDGAPDRLLVSRAAYWQRAPQRGEIVVFRLDSRNTLLDSGLMVKRVVGLGGDIVQINDQGRTVINGAELPEVYAPEASDRVFGPQVVPPDSVFLLGDNRRQSRDSSRFEREPFVAREALVGRAVAVVWPVGRAKLLRQPAYPPPPPTSITRPEPPDADVAEPTVPADEPPADEVIEVGAPTADEPAPSDSEPEGTP